MLRAGIYSFALLSFPSHPSVKMGEELGVLNVRERKKGGKWVALELELFLRKEGGDMPLAFDN